MFARTNQIGAAHALQRLAQKWPVLRIVVAKECLMQAALAQPLGRYHRFRATSPDGLQRIYA